MCEAETDDKHLFFGEEEEEERPAKQRSSCGHLECINEHRMLLYVCILPATGGIYVREGDSSSSGFTLHYLSLVVRIVCATLHLKAHRSHSELTLESHRHWNHRYHFGRCDVAVVLGL